VPHEPSPAAEARRALTAVAERSVALPARIIGVGIDVVDIASIEHNAAIGGERWMRKVFTDTEQADADGNLDRLATRFAGKEAVVKALRTGFRDGVSLRAVEIVCEPGGAPAVVLHGAAAAAADNVGVGRVVISLSRDGGIAAAAAWALSND
jgi:holo-[acyl-carrier protein] synthase